VLEDQAYPTWPEVRSLSRHQTDDPAELFKL